MVQSKKFVWTKKIKLIAKIFTYIWKEKGKIFLGYDYFIDGCVRYEKIILRASRDGSYDEIIDTIIKASDDVLIARRKIDNQDREILDFDLPVTDLPLTSNLINTIFAKCEGIDKLSKYELCVPTNMFSLLVNSAEQMLRISSMKGQVADESFMFLKDQIEKAKGDLENFQVFPIMGQFCSTYDSYISKIVKAPDTNTITTKERVEFSGKKWYLYLAKNKIHHQIYLFLP